MEDVETLISAARARAEISPEGKRLLCLPEILYAAGLRVSELATLPLAAVKRRDCFLFVKGKGGKERLAPLNGEARAAIAAYLDVRAEFLPRGKVGAAEKFLFPSRSADGHLTRRRCHQLLKELAGEAGVDPDKLSPHVLRHAFATIWSKAAPICAACRPCSAIRIFRRRKSTRMWPASGSEA